MAIKHQTTNITVVKHQGTTLTTVYHQGTKVFPDATYQELSTECYSGWDDEDSYYYAEMYLYNPNSFAVTVSFDYIYLEHSTGDWDDSDFATITVSANGGRWITFYTTSAEIYNFWVDMTMSGNGYSWGQDDGWSN